MTGYPTEVGCLLNIQAATDTYCLYWPQRPVSEFSSPLFTSSFSQTPRTLHCPENHFWFLSLVSFDIRDGTCKVSKFYVVQFSIVIFSPDIWFLLSSLSTHIS